MKHENFLLAISKFLLILTIVATLVFVLVLGLHRVPFEFLDLVTNMYHLTASIALVVILLFYSKLSRNRYVVLGTALAVISWAIGQIYWFSFDVITGDMLPYPSVGDFGFIGAYFFLVGSIQMIQSKETAKHVHPIRFLAFLILLLPIALWFASEAPYTVKIYNCIFSAAIAYTLFKCAYVIHLAEYKWFVSGIILLGLADMIFMTTVSLFPQGNTLSTDFLYPIALSLITFGSLKGEKCND